MKLLVLFSLLLCCSAAPVNKEKTRKGKQLEPVVASGYSNVVRGAPNKRIQEYQSSIERLEPEARSALEVHIDKDNQQADRTENQPEKIQSRSDEVKEEAPISILPETVNSDLSAGSVPPPELPHISLLPDGTEVTKTSSGELTRPSEVIANVDDVNPESSITIPQDDVLSQKMEHEAAVQVLGNDQMQMINAGHGSEGDAPTQESLLTEQKLEAAVADDTEKTEPLQDDTEPKELSSPITQSKTAEEVITVPFQVNKVSDDVVVNEEPLNIENKEENLARDLPQFEEAAPATEVPEPVTSVELLSEELKNLPPLEEAKLDDFSSSIILESQPLPKVDDEGSIVELLPSNSESLFDLEINDNQNLNDLVKRSSEDDPAKEYKAAEVSEARQEEDLGTGAIAVQDEQPVEENPVVSVEVKPDCDEDHVNKEDFTVHQPSQNPSVEEIEGQVIPETQSS